MRIPKKYIIKSGVLKGKCDQKLLQTNQPKGSYRRGDKHPIAKNFYYKQWTVNKESVEMWVHASTDYFIKVIKPKSLCFPDLN